MNRTHTQTNVTEHITTATFVGDKNAHISTTHDRILSNKTHTGWPQSRRRKFCEFPRLLQNHNYTLPEVIAIKSIRNNDLPTSI